MKKALLLIGVVFALLLSLTLTSAQGSTNIRVAHFSPDTPAVDVYVDGEVTIEALEFGSVTDFIELPAGTYEVAVAPAGTSIDDAAIGPAPFDLPAGVHITVAAVGSLEAGTLAPAVVVDDYSGLQAGNALVTVFHAIEDAPAVDILADGALLIDSLAFPGTQGGNDGASTREVPAGTYDITVTPDATDDVVIDLSGTTFEAGVAYFVAATNVLADPQVVVATERVRLLGETLVAGAEGTVVDAAVGSADFTTLVSALTTVAPDYVEALSGEGPFTVFAPTDEAFEEAFSGLGISLLELLIADPALVREILAYHVIPGTPIAGEDVVRLGGGTFASLQGEDLVVTLLGDAPVINQNIFITQTDIVTGNGIIHVIDDVLIPSSAIPTIIELTLQSASGSAGGDDMEMAEEEMMEEEMMEPMLTQIELDPAAPTIAEIATGDENFSILVTALTAAAPEFVEALSGEGTFTVFAPTDEAFTSAFESLGIGAEDLLANPEIVRTILAYHVVADGAYGAEGIVGAFDPETGTVDLNTLAEEPLTVGTFGGAPVINQNVFITATDIVASNGVVHVIDNVLIPTAVVNDILTLTLTAGS